MRPLTFDTHIDFTEIQESEQTCIWEILIILFYKINFQGTSSVSPFNYVYGTTLARFSKFAKFSTCNEYEWNVISCRRSLFPALWLPGKNWSNGKKNNLIKSYSYELKYRAASAFNSLPKSITKFKTLDVFKKRLKEHFLILLI